MQQKSYTIKSLKQMAALGAQVGSLLQMHDVILLKGDLGTGKSTFARALIQALCGKNIEVPSPTFTLVQTYDAPAFSLWHFDLYRLKEPEEAYELGLEEAYERGVSLIEWPERLGAFLPQEYLEIEFAYGIDETERILTFRGWDERNLKRILLKKRGV